MDKRSVCIIGVGKVGSALSFEFNEADLKHLYLIDKKVEILRRIVKKLNRCRYSGIIKKEFIELSDTIIISVQDSEVLRVIDDLSRRKIDLSGKLILHTSGALSSDVFKILNISKSQVGSFHPIQTFSRIQYSKSNILKGIYFSIEGGVKAKKIQREFCKEFEAFYIEIPKGKKLIYHTSCVIASNFLVTYINILSGIIEKIGIKGKDTYKIFEPIITETLLNISRQGHVKSLTGPFDRSDVITIRGHLTSILEENPLLLPFYTSLAKETIKVAMKKKSISKAKMNKLNKILDEFNKV
jgi:predicted short-subunit dehydrogenase-like oxidoreductase (DUF2520 family)